MLCTAIACANGAPPTTSPDPASIPITGRAVPGMASFDRVISDLMRRWDIPGGAVAVVKDGRLVYARGFGYADLPQRVTVEPDALFRVASVSKPITGAAILKLVEEGRLDLDAKAFDLLSRLPPVPGVMVDPRLEAITVRQLLQHLGGWDRDQSFDPMFRSTEAAQALGVRSPASAETVIRWMRGKPLEFDPGTRYAYSNFDYAVLGRIIETITGQTYEQFVRERVLIPAGATRMRIARSLEAERFPDEVRYYHVDSAASVFPGGGTVPWPYGGFFIEAMDAHGGWLASTIDLVRFATAVDSLPTRPDVLRPESVGLMVFRPSGVWATSPYHYGMGWLVRPGPGNWWHNGSLPGTASLLVRTGGGLIWAAVFNARAMKPGSTFEQELDPAIWQAVRGVTEWPVHDLFGQFR
jgi:N-acyl-D-amino-acid deacylase